MQVKLISVTPNAEQTILYCARVSSDQSKTGTGLLKYLIRNKHWSPFELAHMTVEIITSRAIAPQILRHRSFSFQEFSQRYATPEECEIYEARRQAESNRQSSVDDLDEEAKQWFRGMQAKQWHIGMSLYKQATETYDIAKECARIFLPPNTQTKIYMSGSVRSWIHYFDLRTEEHTQQEHRDIACAIEDIFHEQFPVIGDALFEIKLENEPPL